MAGSLVFGQNLAHRLVPGGPVDAYKPQKSGFGSGCPVGFTLELDHPRIQALRILKNGNAKVLANDMQQKPALYIPRAAGAGTSHANVSSTKAGQKSFTFQAGQTVAKDVFSFGFVTILHTINGISIPETYAISSNSASSGSSPHTVTLYLAEELRRNIDNTVAVQVSGSPFFNCQRGTDSSNDAAGVPLVDVDANYYYAAVVKGYIPLQFATDVATAGVNNQQIGKTNNGQVELLSAAAEVGRTPIGHLVGNITVLNANYSRWGLCYIDLT